MSAERPVILLVEDDPDDVFFLQQAFKEAGLPDALRVARDGEEAIAYLLANPLPILILLDLKLPRKTGLEVLEWRRHQPEIKRIPVLMLTSSGSNADITNAYDLGANAYLVKPVGTESQLEMVKAIQAFWLTLNKLPEPSTPSPKTS